MDTEAFIRSRAAMGWSRAMVRGALEISDMKFRLMLDALPDIKWPARNAGVGRQRYYEELRGGCKPYQMENMLKAVDKSAQMRRKMVVICGQTLWVNDAYELWKEYIDVTPRHILWRLRQGQSDYEALFAPRQDSATGQKKGDWHKRKFLTEKKYG